MFIRDPAASIEAMGLAPWLAAPGLSLTLLTGIVGYTYRPNEALQIALIVSISILALLFKGAIVAFYVRQPATTDS